MGLAGLTVGVPAARRAAETAKLVERWGGKTVVGPTVQEIPVDDWTEVIQATRRVIDAPAAWSVHLTGVGTRRWFEAARESELLDALLAALGRASVIPRGLKAATALRDYSLQAAWMPEGETSSEIAEWLAPKVSEGDVVALQRHGEPVPALSDALRISGAEVVELATYRWALPDDTGPAEALVDALISGRAQAMVVTSAPQVRNLMRLAAQMGRDQELKTALAERVFLAAVGEVAGGGLVEAGLSADLIASPARMGALVRELAGARDEVLAKAGGL
jgi:uroporphyrinogen-III synthase